MAADRVIYQLFYFSFLCAGMSNSKNGEDTCREKGRSSCPAEIPDFRCREDPDMVQ